jgi:hypothetical protein
MRVASPSLLAFFGIAGLGCIPSYPIYQYEYISPASQSAEFARIEARFASVLEAEGYHASPVRQPRQIPDPGFRQCSQPTDLVTWEKTLPANRHAWVDQIRCSGHPWFYIHARLPSERKAEGARVRSVLDQVFANELANGTLRFSMSHEIDLE